MKVIKDSQDLFEQAIKDVHRELQRAMDESAALDIEISYQRARELTAARAEIARLQAELATSRVSNVAGAVQRPE